MSQSTDARLRALAIPAVDDYLNGVAKGVDLGERVRLLEHALLALLVALETAIAVGVPPATAPKKK